MSDELKREWQETPPPSEACDRARERAWRRVSTPYSAVWPRWTPVAAGALAAIALAVVFWPLVAEWLDDSRSAMPEGRTRLAVRNPVSRGPVPLPAEREIVPSPPAGVRATVVPVKRTQTPRKETTRQAAKVSPPRQEKLVVNLTLPETGVRMIWILDEDFGRTTEARND